MAFYRDIYTGELKERPASSVGREILYVEEIPACLRRGRGSDNPWSRPWVSATLGVANLAQIPEYNEAAKKYAGPGVSFDQQGNIVCESRAARNRALKWMGKIDYSGGYGDYTSTKRAA